MRLLLPLLSLLILTACSNTIKVEETTDDGGKIVYYVSKDDGAREGEYTQYYPDGEVMSTATYVNDTLDGERRIFYPDGTLQILETYDNGDFEGPYANYYEDGNPLSKGNYVNSMQEGEWESYYPGGQLRYLTTFEKGLENGPFVEYYDNGTMSARGTFKQGENEQGKLEKFDKETGDLYQTMQCEMGRCSTTYLREGYNAFGRIPADEDDE